jgi:cyanophycinase-like exopeptidase
MNGKSTPAAGTLTIIGSGEMARSMSKVHRAVMSRVSGSTNAVFLDTPAGFELNADRISARAVRYFQKHLQTEIDVVSFKSAFTTTPDEIQSVLEKLLIANFIFAGPGSPTYAVRNWRDTVVFEAVARRLASGAHLVLASAAAIAVGRYALPVYEIYKVGEAPHWKEGLNLLCPYGLDLAIIPHWNNAEGGTHDTRYCFVGKPRFLTLEARLPDTTTILGVDEYSACILDLSNGDGRVIGAGQVTIRRRGRETAYPAGSVFSLDRLKRAQLEGKRGNGLSASPSPPAPETDAPAHRPQPDQSVPGAACGDGAPSDISFIELLVAVRAQLRADEQWGLADEIRQRLAKLGIVVEDGPTETTWRRD